MACSPHVVVVVGAPSSGVTTLARDLAGLLETFDSFIASPVDSTHHARIAALFRQGMAAARNAAGGRGAVLDGCIACELTLIDLDMHHGRLTCAQRAHHLTRLCNALVASPLYACALFSSSRRHAEATGLKHFCTSLLRHMPPPDMVIYLDVSPEMRLARAKAGSALALCDHELLGEGTRELMRGLADKGCEVYTRKWDRFGRTAPIRDTVLCHPPQPARASTPSASPSPAAVERILQVCGAPGELADHAAARA